MTIAIVSLIICLALIVDDGRMANGIHNTNNLSQIERFSPIKTHKNLVEKIQISPISTIDFAWSNAKATTTTTTELPTTESLTENVSSKTPKYQSQANSWKSSSTTTTTTTTTTEKSPIKSKERSKKKKQQQQQLKVQSKQMTHLFEQPNQVNDHSPSTKIILSNKNKQIINNNKQTAATIVQVNNNNNQSIPVIGGPSSTPIWINLGLVDEMVSASKARMSNNRPQRSSSSSSSIGYNNNNNININNNNNNNLAFQELRTNENHAVNCSQLIGLTKGQAQLCSLYKDHMPFVGLGARLTIDECQWQMRHERWNCSVHDPVSVFGPIIKLGVREMALVNALSSASVVYTIARACREGRLANCACTTGTPRPKSLNSAWKWEGCSDNLDYAYKFAEEFVDLRERELPIVGKWITTSIGNNQNKNSKRSIADQQQTITSSKNNNKNLIKQLDKKRLMNIHNNQVGRRAVVRKSKIVCKCHGVSGVCSLVTCWQQLSSFRDIGDTLRARYDAANEVRFSQQDGKLQVRNKRNIGSNLQQVTTKITPDDLIYVEQSPDFCRRIDRIDYGGTKGRVCSSSSPGAPDNCRKLCCARGHQSIKRTISYRCNCRHNGLIGSQPQCQVCQTTQVQNICN